MRLHMHVGKFRRFAARASVGGLALALAYPLLGTVAPGQERIDNLRYVTVTRGDIVQNVTAAGTLEAVDTVEVSSQISGQIAKLFADHNSIVRADEPLAALDSTSFGMTVRQAEANLVVAQAQYDESKAAVESANARHAEALRDFQVKSALAKTGGVALLEAERAQANADAQGAELSAAKARAQGMAAGIDAARASVERARLDLERTTIRSPIDGVVILRSVERGQTVAATLQAPTLFTIARDLSDMRVYAAVSEADIGVVRTGQRAFFAVDSYPGRSFEGRVLQIRKAPQMVQNIVTYTVVISAPNPKGLLFPGMTADTRIAIEEQRNTVVIPNAALNFRPRGASVARNDPGKGVVWVRRSIGHLDAVNVALGATSDSLTQVLSPGIKAGDQIAIGYQAKSEAVSGG
jgi:HlyD family secretion protein